MKIELFFPLTLCFLLLSQLAFSQTETYLPVWHDEQLIFYQTDGVEKFRVEGYSFASKLELDFNCFKEGLCALIVGSYGKKFETHYIDTSGKVQINIGSNYGNYFSEGLARIYDKINNNFFFINSDGEKAFEIIGSPDDYFSDGMIITQHLLEDSVSYVDKTGMLLFTKSRKKVNLAKAGFSNGLALFESELSGNGYTYINKKGEIVIKGNHKKPYRFSEGLAEVKIDFSTYGYIDTTGDLVISVKSDKCEPFSDGLAGVKSKGKWGFINQKGEWAIEPSFRKAHAFKEGYAAVIKSKNWFVVNNLGQIVFQDSLATYMEYVGDQMVFVNYHGENNYAYIKIDNSLSIAPKPEFIQFTSTQTADKYSLEQITSYSSHPYYNLVDQDVWRRPSIFASFEKINMALHSNILPTDFFKYVHLKKLDLSYNLLREIPLEMCSLENLEELNLKHNLFEKIPNNLHCLEHLIKIDLGYNRISKLPEQGVVFKNVEYLNLIGTPLAKIPGILDELKKHFPKATIKIKAKNNMGFEIK